MKLTQIILEGWNDREAKGKLSQLDYNTLNSYFDGKKVSAPNPGDSLRRINDEQDWENWKKETIERLGDVEIELDRQADWFNKIKILDPSFQKSKADYVAAKAAWIGKERSAGKTSGLD